MLTLKKKTLGLSFPRHKLISGTTPLKTNMTVDYPPFEDVFPIENGEFPVSC